MTQNQLAYARLQEEARANQAREAENIRSHLASESIDRIKASASERQSYASQSQAATSIAHYKLQEHMETALLPYRKAQLLSKSFSDLSKGVESAAKTSGIVFD